MVNITKRTGRKIKFRNFWQVIDANDLAFICTIDCKLAEKVFLAAELMEDAIFEEDFISVRIPVGSVINWGMATRHLPSPIDAAKLTILDNVARLNPSRVKVIIDEILTPIFCS